MSKTRVVITHPEMGIYLGSFLGLGLWSKMDPAGQDAAVTFESEAEAQIYILSWDNIPENLSCKPVIADQGNYATIQSIAYCGLEAWDPSTLEKTRE